MGVVCGARKTTYIIYMFVVVVAGAIILAIAVLIGAVFMARRLDREEPGPTYYDPKLYRGHHWHG